MSIKAPQPLNDQLVFPRCSSSVGSLPGQLHSPSGLDSTSSHFGKLSVVLRTPQVHHIHMESLPAKGHLCFSSPYFWISEYFRRKCFSNSYSIPSKSARLESFYYSHLSYPAIPNLHGYPSFSAEHCPSPHWSFARVSSEQGRTVVESIPQAWITDCEGLGKLLKLTVDPPIPCFLIPISQGSYNSKWDN